MSADLSGNDLRVLRAVEYACGEWDGFIPHGASDWMAIRRLEQESLVEQCDDYGSCQTCGREHESAMYRLTKRVAKEAFK